MSGALAGRRVFVAGHRGLVGSAVCRVLAEAGVADPLRRTREKLDLADAARVEALFQAERPEVVFLCAARVGGIAANERLPASFLHQNLAIQQNVLHAAWRHGVQRLVFLGSSCIYPRDCPQPMREEHLLQGPLEPTNQAYAVAKIAGVEACRAYNREHGTRFVALMPSNLYGPGDSYDLESAHVLPALIRKCREAVRDGRREVVLWGSGTPLREFTWSDDAARAAVLLASLADSDLDAALTGLAWPMFNAGSGEEVSIAGLAARVATATGFQGEFRLDASRPDGVRRKLMDSSRLRALGWVPQVSLEQGLALACEDFATRQGAAHA